MDINRMFGGSRVLSEWALQAAEMDSHLERARESLWRVRDSARFVADQLENSDHFEIARGYEPNSEWQRARLKLIKTADAAARALESESLLTLDEADVDLDSLADRQRPDEATS